jgi:enoyl-CoA hydratase/carnithine racemase
MTDKGLAMMVRELRAALASMEANSEVQVVLFKNDGTCEVFDLEEVLSNNGNAQLEIYEAEPVREENPEG